MFQKIANQKALRKVWQSLKNKGLFSQFADYEDWNANRDRKPPKEKVSMAAVEASVSAANR